MEKEKKKRSMKPSYARHNPLEKGKEVYFRAFTKQEPEMLYVCQGQITKVSEGEKNQIYRVQVSAVSEKSITGEISDQQRSLIGRAITKRKHELTLRLGSIFQPKTWLS